MKYLATLILVVMTFTGCQKRPSKVVTRPQKTGITTVRFYDEARSRPVVTEVWYPIEDHTPAEPTEGLWLRCAEARDAPLKTTPEKYPLIVMSHGNGGDRMNNSWLAEILAANGFIVGSCVHHGNTWNNKIAESFVRIWERPKDVSFVVDQLLQHEKFNSSINCHKIGFIGYSLGGQTGIWIAGGKISDLGKETIQTIPVDQLPENIDENLINSIDFTPATHSYRDHRISAVFIMAPALGYLFDLSSLQAISIPVHIVASEGDLVTPIENSAKFLASTIKKAVFTLISGNANHYVFLNEVSKGGKMLLDKRVALDPPNVNRGEIHEQIGHSAVTFFHRHLK
jgi:predicted dienelactone hydrolase